MASAHKKASATVKVRRRTKAPVDSSSAGARPDISSKSAIAPLPGVTCRALLIIYVRFRRWLRLRSREFNGWGSGALVWDYAARRSGGWESLESSLAGEY